MAGSKKVATFAQKVQKGKGLVLPNAIKMAQPLSANPFKGLVLNRLKAIDYSDVQIRHVVELITSKKSTLQMVLKRHPIGDRTLRRWVKTVRDGGEFHKTNGRKPNFDEEAIKKVQDELIVLQRSGKSPNNIALNQLLLSNSNLTRERRDLAGTNTSLSKSALKRIKKKTGVGVCGHSSGRQRPAANFE